MSAERSLEDLILKLMEADQAVCDRVQWLTLFFSKHSMNTDPPQREQAAAASDRLRTLVQQARDSRAETPAETAKSFDWAGCAGSSWPVCRDLSPMPELSPGDESWWRIHATLLFLPRTIAGQCLAALAPWDPQAAAATLPDPGRPLAEQPGVWRDLVSSGGAAPPELELISDRVTQAAAEPGGRLSPFAAFMACIADSAAVLAVAAATGVPDLAWYHPSPGRPEAHVGQPLAQGCHDLLELLAGTLARVSGDHGSLTLITRIGDL
jgi:hypothetical protein